MGLRWTGANPDGSVRLQVRLHIEGDRFELAGTYKGHRLSYALEGARPPTVTVDGKPGPEVPEELRKKLVLDREQGLFWRNYFGFLAALPMNLRGSGVLVEPAVETTRFAERKVRAVQVRFAPDVGTDRWTFYFDPKTSALVGYRFVKADPKADGEYIALDGEVIAHGLRLPAQRRWYVNADDRFLGTDTLSDLEVGPPSSD